MTLRVLLVGGPMYDPLYGRISEFEEREGVRVETVVAPPIPFSTSGSRTSSPPAQPGTT